MIKLSDDGDISKLSFTNDEIDVIATSLVLTVKSAEMYEQNGRTLDLVDKLVLDKVKAVLKKIEDGL